MKINELINKFEIYTNNEEKRMLEYLKHPKHLSEFTEHEQFTIEGLVKKSLVIKIGTDNPRVVANEL